MLAPVGVADDDGARSWLASVPGPPPLENCCSITSTSLLHETLLVWYRCCTRTSNAPISTEAGRRRQRRSPCAASATRPTRRPHPHGPARVAEPEQPDRLPA